MDAVSPKVLHEHRHNAPKKAPCPCCGTLGRRRQRLHRTVRSIAYHAILIVHVTTAEYTARCDCCKTFRTQIEGIEPKAKYTNRVREAVLDRLLDDHMSLEQIRKALCRDFLLELSDGFLYDSLDWKIRQLEMASYREWTLKEFSGTMCIDELHLGRYTLLLATDPLSDFPIAFALVEQNDQLHMERFLRNLQRCGFLPRVVITDGSNLYPKLLAEIWPDAKHQLCVFHVLKDINDCVLDAVRRLRRQMARRGAKGRRRRRGRPTRRQARERKRRGRTQKQKAHFVFKHRYLIVTRRENLSEQQRKELATMLQYQPELGVLRRFVDKLHGLFEPKQSQHQAWCRRAALASKRQFQADPDLARAIEMLVPEKFQKMIAFLHSPARQRVRTNNHVERTNRKLRHYEKVRYRWRRRRTIVRFVVLAIHRHWLARRQSSATSAPSNQRSVRSRRTSRTTAATTVSRLKAG